MKKELKELSHYEYNMLKATGFLYEFYPSAIGNFRVDVLGESVSELLNEVENDN